MFSGLEALQQLRLPDAWQMEAIQALGAGHDVIVQAPTGAGKTFIFEQYYQQRRSGGTAIYTVPTRALANDKFAEWNRLGWRVGITTGDLAHDPGAPLIVATLEAQQTPRGADLYVVDEFQWLGDPLRGNHYEGTLLALPETTQLLLLSGSVANPGAVRDWLRRLQRGREVTLVEQKTRPVPLEEVEIETAARRLPSGLTGYWTRRLAAALREDLGPILVFAPHRREAEKIARDVALQLPITAPLRLTRAQEQAAGTDLARLLMQRVAYHHSGLGYQQRAGLIEPLAKGGQLRVVVATLGLSAGINFSLRSVLVTGTRFNAGGLPREVTPADLLQMFGRAGRRGLDEQGYVLVSEHSPRLSQARAGHLRRSPPLPWRVLLRELAQGRTIEISASRFQSRLFTTEIIPLGIERTGPELGPLPCNLRTDPGRARLVRRTKDPAPFCLPCPHRPECLALDPRPLLLWLWNRLGLLDRNLQLTRRGRVMANFVGPEGLGIIAGIEDEKYPLPDLLEDMANLVAGDRFCGQEPRWGGRLGYVCQRAYKRFQIEGFLNDGLPVNYGAGGAEIVRTWRVKKYVPAPAGEEAVARGDIDRLLIEWKSLLRQVAGATPEPDWPRWQAFQALCRAEIAPYEKTSLPELPALTAEQQTAISHRAYG